MPRLHTHASQSWDLGALVLRSIILLVLQKFLDKDVKLLAQSLNRLMSVLSQLLTVLDLHLEQLPQLLVVVLELLISHGLAENIVAVALRLEALAGISLGSLAVLCGKVVQNKCSKVLDVIHVLHKSVVVLLEQVRRLGATGEHILHRAESEVLGAGCLQPDADLWVTMHVDKVHDASIVKA